MLELNQIGHQGWEAIALSYDKDAEGVMNWTCWLKRPAGVAAEDTHAAVATPAAATHDTVAGPKQPDGFDLSDGDFGLKD